NDPQSPKDPTTGQPKNRFGQHTYSIAVGEPIRRDGAAWALDWDNIKPQATEMYDALMYTFAPELKGDQNDCKGAQTCRAIVQGDVGGFGARPLGIYFIVPNVHLPQPAASTPNQIYAFYVKLLPFSNADMWLKLDDEGPLASAKNIGDPDLHK